MTALIGSLIGFDLAPSKGLSTLPISLIVLGNALNIFPAVLILKKIGRKKGSLLGIMLAIGSAVLAMYSLSSALFYVYCASQFMFGM